MEQRSIPDGNPTKPEGKPWPPALAGTPWLPKSSLPGRIEAQGVPGLAFARR
jgi:hypothetical protein